MNRKQAKKALKRRKSIIEQAIMNNHYMQSMMAFDDELHHVREKVLSQVSELEGYEFKSKLKEYVYNDECGCYVNINAPFEIVDECHYKLEEEDEEDYGLKCAVDQYQNGGWTGDDYAGAVYVLLPKSGKFFKYHYHC